MERTKHYYDTKIDGDEVLFYYYYDNDKEHYFIECYDLMYAHTLDNNYNVIDGE